MCPFCLATMGLIVAGAASTGGLAALAVKVSRKRTEQQKLCRVQIKGEIKMSTSMIENPKIVSREEWLVARKKLLAKEKQLTRQRDAVAAERRQLPWVKVDKNYVFDGPNGKVTLADLCDGKSQLIIYHVMFGPDWQEACPSCSFNVTSVTRPVSVLRDLRTSARNWRYAKLAPFTARRGYIFRNGNSLACSVQYHGFAKINLCRNAIAQAALSGGSGLGSLRRLFLHITGSTATTVPQS